MNNLFVKQNDTNCIITEINANNVAPTNSLINSETSIINRIRENVYNRNVNNYKTCLFSRKLDELFLHFKYIQERKLKYYRLLDYFADDYNEEVIEEIDGIEDDGGNNLKNGNYINITQNKNVISYTQCTKEFNNNSPHYINKTNKDYNINVLEDKIQTSHREYDKNDTNIPIPSYLIDKDNLNNDVACNDSNNIVYSNSNEINSSSIKHTPTLNYVNTLKETIRNERLNNILLYRKKIKKNRVKLGLIENNNIVLKSQAVEKISLINKITNPKIEKINKSDKIIQEYMLGMKLNAIDINDEVLNKPINNREYKNINKASMPHFYNKYHKQLLYSLQQLNINKT